MVTLNLHKPLCFFDLETTGIDTLKDRIVEIAILKILPNQAEEQYKWVVNPQITIPKQASDVHGITDDMVKDAPIFSAIAPKIIQIIKHADLAGFNSNRFDVPLLAEELARAGQDFDIKKHRLVDIQVIYHKKEPRNLSAAYAYYCNKSLEHAHSAMADTQATYEVLKGQLEKYPDLENSIEHLSSFSSHHRFADIAGRIAYDKSGSEIFNFGKYQGQKVETVFETDKGYYNWIMNADFPHYTKRVLTAIKMRKLMG